MTVEPTTDPERLNRMTPIPDHVAFGDPDRRPRCAQGGPEIANLFTSPAAGSLDAARRICRGCELGPWYEGDVCWSWRQSQGDAIAAGGVFGGRWVPGKLDFGAGPDA